MCTPASFKDTRHEFRARRDPDSSDARSSSNAVPEEDLATHRGEAGDYFLLSCLFP